MYIRITIFIVFFHSISEVVIFLQKQTTEIKVSDNKAKKQNSFTQCAKILKKSNFIVRVARLKGKINTYSSKNAEWPILKKILTLILSVEEIIGTVLNYIALYLAHIADCAMF